MKNTLFRSINILCLLLLLFFSPSRADDGGDYVIGPADLLKISVWETPNLDVEMPVRPDGKISFPLIGDLLVSGMTPSQLRETLAKKLSTYIHEPQVSVLVMEINSVKVYIQGAIAKPGEYKLDKRTNLLELLSIAGGITADADLKRSYLLRANKRFKVDIYALVEEGDISQNIELNPRDIIFIPQRKIAGIIVLGEVRQPKLVAYFKGMSLLDAILEAGGFTEQADLDDIRVIRQALENEEIEIDADAILNDGEIEQNIKLVPADIVIVGKSWL